LKEVTNVRITILPKTPLGWWSVGLVIALIVLFAVLPEDPDAELRALDRALAIGFAGISGAASVTGLVGIIKRRERSVLVFLTTAIGLFALIIAVGQAFGKTIGW
jgi:nitrate reductase gamma subunit